MVYQWMDVIWLPLGLFIATKGQRWLVSAFFITCMIMMRLQVEVMQSINYPNGFAGLLSSGAFERGMVTYSLFYVIYLILVYFSPNSRGVIFFAASISIFFMAFFISSMVMLL